MNVAYTTTYDSQQATTTRSGGMVGRTGSVELAGPIITPIVDDADTITTLPRNTHAERESRARMNARDLRL
jgi:hypothetical protein